MLKEGKVPIRTCVGCGAKRPKRELLRVVRLPGGEVRFDPDQRLEGRGAYLCPRSECIRRGLRRRKLSRALGGRVPPELAGVLERAAEIYREEEEEVNCGGEG